MEIKKLQRSTELLIRVLPFQRLIRELATNYTTEPFRFTAESLMALQEAAEDFLVCPCDRQCELQPLVAPVGTLSWGQNVATCWDATLQRTTLHCTTLQQLHGWVYFHSRTPNSAAHHSTQLLLIMPQDCQW
jgi:hypothetical protein